MECDIYPLTLTSFYSVQVYSSLKVFSFNLAVWRVPPDPATFVHESTILAWNDDIASPTHAKI